MNLKAEIIAIGTELLIGHVVNTNATYLSEELNALGISTYFHTTVGDNPERIKSCLNLACSRSDLIICTGGLGPTSDDITHEVIAEFTAKPLVEDMALRQQLIEKYETFKRRIPEINFRQALIPEGATLVPNPTGTATGIILKHHGVTIITFPGVPSEMKNMFEDEVRGFLRDNLLKQNITAVISSRKIKFFNIGESQMAEILGEKIFSTSNPSVAPYASLGECYVRITAKGATSDETSILMQPVIDEVEAKMQDYIYAYDDETVPSILAQYLKERKLSIAFAESCTGGLLAKTMTDMPGSSAYMKLSLVTYSNEAKMKFLNLSSETLSLHGAVSGETAEEMAYGLSLISDSNINVSITGIAGPDGGSLEKPVGTIFISILFQELEGSAEEVFSDENAEVGVQQPSHVGTVAKPWKIVKHITQQLDWFSRKLNREQVRELAMLKTLYETYKFISNL